MKVLKLAGVIAFWLLVWQVVSLIVGNLILLCGPLDVLATLASDVVALSFWSSIGFSFLRIVLGFVAAFVSGLVLGALAWRFSAFATIFDPAVQFIKSVPIVCFIVLLLIWFGALYVSAIAVFLVAFPAVYFSTIEGLKACDTKMLEMLKIFRVPTMRRILALYWPTMLPFLTATGKIAVGMSWKAGVAAELIGLPLGSIGESLYQAKITLSSADLLAWTVVIVFISMVCERTFLWLLRKTDSWSWKLALPRYRGEESSEHNFVGAKVHLESVSKSFGDQEVIRDLSFSVSPGGKVGLFSPSGSGKTTLLGLVTGLHVPDQGSVESNVRASMVFQEARVFESRSTVDNVLLMTGYRTSRSYTQKIIEELLPNQDLEKPISQLSGGQRRRVEIIRALASPSDLVILDEPFSGLDVQTKIAAQDFILEHLKERSLILASHDTQDFKALQIDEIIESAIGVKDQCFSS